MGTVGTAQVAGYEETRDRPAPGPYPIFRCRDGHVRIVLLAPRQWHAMRAWLGEPEDLQDPELETIAGRARASGRLHTAFEDHFRDRGKHELTLDGQARGVPIAPVLTTADVLAAEHFRARGAIARSELARGIVADAPTGFAEIDGRRVRAARRAPDLGEHDDEVFAEPSRAPHPVVPDGRGPRRPLEGLRVLDFGVIVLGAEAARLFCDLGADVIKIESRAFPDGARVSPVHFAIGHRGSRSVGVNLRTPEGVDVIRRLVAQSDVVLANFKPGTMDRLGLGTRALREINPGIVVVSEQRGRRHRPVEHLDGLRPARAMRGRHDEPLALPRRRGGLQRQHDDPPRPLRGPDQRRHARSPPSSAAGARGAARRSRRPRPRRSSMQTSTLLVEEALRPGAIVATGNAGRHAAPWGVYPCAGDDEWCVVTVRDDGDWRRLRGALGDPRWAADPDLARAAGRIARRAEIDARLAAWTRDRSPRALTAILQAAGVPAGFMQRPAELEHDPHLEARDVLRTFAHARRLAADDRERAVPRRAHPPSA